MSELADWLLEQIAEDERVARLAALSVGWRGFGDERVESGKSWIASYHEVKRIRSDDAPPSDRTVADCGSLMLDRAKHIAAFDPARVLAECESKRRIIAEHGANKYRVDPCDAHDARLETIPCATLRLLALPYADRQGFREEWRP